MKTSMTCTCMLSYDKDAFKLLKTAKTTISTCTKVSRLMDLLFLLLQINMPLIRNMAVKLDVELYHIFAKISKFGYWLVFIDAENKRLS